MSVIYDDICDIKEMYVNQQKELAVLCLVGSEKGLMLEMDESSVGNNIDEELFPSL